METEMLLREADEALRQEKMEALWREWGSTIVGMALMVVFGTMAGVGWTNWRNSIHEQQTEILLGAQENGSSALLMQKDGLSGHYKGLANLLAAGNLAETESAAVGAGMANILYGLMTEAEESGLPGHWDILAAWARMRTQADAIPDKTVKIEAAGEMQRLAEKRNNPYAAAILTEAAAIYGENGDPDKALSLLQEAKDKNGAGTNVPLSEMIDNLIHLYTVDAALLQEKRP